MLIAMQRMDLAGQRTTHRDPVHDFDTLAACEFDEIMRIDVDELADVAGHCIHADLVEILVDEAGTFAVELVRQSACADDDDLDVLVVGVKGTADRAAEFRAARERRKVMVQGIDRDRHEFHVPRSLTRPP